MQRDRADDGDLGAHVDEMALPVVGEVQLRVPALREEPVRLDDRLHDDGVEGAGRDLLALLPENLEHERIPVLLEVVVEDVFLPDLEIERAQIVDESDLVARCLAQRGAGIVDVLLGALPLTALGVDVVLLDRLVAELVLVLVEAARGEGVGVDPRSVAIPDLQGTEHVTRVEAELHRVCGMPVHRVDREDLHETLPHRKDPELHLVDQLLARLEGYVGSLHGGHLREVDPDPILGLLRREWRRGEKGECRDRPQHIDRKSVV